MPILFLELRTDPYFAIMFAIAAYAFHKALLAGHIGISVWIFAMLCWLGFRTFDTDKTVVL